MSDFFEPAGEVPDYLADFAHLLDNTPMMIVVPIKKFRPWRYRKAIRKMSRYFQIPASTVSLLAVAGHHGYELVTSDKHVMLIKYDSVFDRMVLNEPQLLQTAIDIESDSIIKVL